MVVGVVVAVVAVAVVAVAVVVVVPSFVFVPRPRPRPGLFVRGVSSRRTSLFRGGTYTNPPQTRKKEGGVICAPSISNCVWITSLGSSIGNRGVTTATCFTPAHLAHGVNHTELSAVWLCGLR